MHISQNLVDAYGKRGGALVRSAANFDVSTRYYNGQWGASGKGCTRVRAEINTSTPWMGDAHDASMAEPRGKVNRAHILRIAGGVAGACQSVHNPKP